MSLFFGNKRKNIFLTLILLSFSLLAILSFLDFKYKVFIFIAYFIYFYTLYNSETKTQAFFYAFIFSFFHFSFGLKWLFSVVGEFDGIGKLSIFLILLGVVLFLSILLGLTAILQNNRFLKTYYLSIYLLIFIPSLATFYEYIREFLFTGLTWYSPAYALLDIGFNSLFSFGGVILVNYIFFTIIGIFLHLFILGKTNILYPFSLLLILLILKIISLNIIFTKPITDNKINIQIINSKFNKTDKTSRYKVLQRVKEFTSLAILNTVPKLSIWPESVISTNYKDLKIHMKKIRYKLKSNNISVFTGAYIEKNNKSYNSLFFLNEEKVLYTKNHLIPFGEYTPKWAYYLKAFLPIIHKDNLHVTTKENKIFNFKNINISASICFELIFPSELRKRNANSNILVHISDLGWFDKSWAEKYLLQNARVRAMESQKPMIYSVNHGNSAFINKFGQITSDKGITIEKIVIPQKGKTLWENYGNFTTLFLILINLIILILTRIQCAKYIKI